MSNLKGRYIYEYERPAVTVDIAVVTREADPRILLIRRKDDPFAGAWALPGGFVDPGETLADAAHRELREETGLGEVDLEQLAAFGDPGRDPRGWTITVTFLVRVDAKRVTPMAGDDAAALSWHSLASPPTPLAFDHDQMIARVRARLAAFAP
ncbi:MAG: NUDIX hydrolase [Gemmataceae bacterium]